MLITDTTGQFTSNWRQIRIQILASYNFDSHTATDFDNFDRWLMVC